MINLAEDNYPNGQLFTTPWNFWVIDDFFDNATFTKIISLKDNNIFSIVDKSNGERITNLNAIAAKQDDTG